MLTNTDVGKAQREVPVHIANEYCRDDRSFNPCPEFNEGALRRTLMFNNFATNFTSWFPLASSPSGLGFDFGLAKVARGGRTCYLLAPSYPNRPCRYVVAQDHLVAVRRLDEVRTADLTQSREILNVEEPNHGFGL
jgi:hypothetical protein